MQLKTLLPSALAVTATAILGGLASRPAQSAWYAEAEEAAVSASTASVSDRMADSVRGYRGDIRGHAGRTRATRAAARTTRVHRRVGVQPGSQRQLVVVVLQPATARYVGDRRGRVDGQQRGPDQAIDGRAGRQEPLRWPPIRRGARSPPPCPPTSGRLTAAEVSRIRKVWTGLDPLGVGSVEIAPLTEQLPDIPGW